MVRVLQIGLSSFPGGVENSIMNYYREINKENIHIDFLSTEDSFAYSGEVLESGSKIIHIDPAAKNPIKYVAKLVKALKIGKYDIVHINMLSAANMAPVIAALFAKKKLIIHAHNSSLPGGKVRKILHFINKPLLSLVKCRRCACSEDAAKWLFGNRNAIVLNNAISIEKFSFSEEKRTEIREHYRIAPENFVIGHVGRFGEEKNHRFLIDVFEEVHKIIQDARLLLVGDGRLFEEIVSYSDSRGLKDNVIFAGKTDDTAKLYSAMDVFCLPSLFEGLGIVAIEAQANGLNCICSLGVPERAKVFNTTIRIPLEKDTWIEKIVKYANCRRTEGTIQKMIDAGYDIRTEASKLEKVYLELLGE